MASDEESKSSLDESKLHEEAFSPYEIPTARHLDGLTGHCHCVARREGGNRNKRIVLYLESETHLSAKPLFVAQKQKEGKFFIYDVSDNFYRINRNFRKDSLNYVGKICRKRFPKSKIISNTLFLGTKADKKQVASLVYDTVSLRYPVLEGYPDRLVYSILQAPPKTSQADDQDGHPAMLPPCIDDIISLHSTHIAEVADYYNSVKVLKSRRRSSGGNSKNRQPFLARFRGRGGRPSQKNIQIVKPNTDEIMFQMARWNEDEFTVDFKSPYSAFTAFGIALAQLDL